jgi:hypothetical protein
LQVLSLGPGRGRLQRQHIAQFPLFAAPGNEQVSVEHRRRELQELGPQIAEPDELVDLLG